MVELQVFTFKEPPLDLTKLKKNNVKTGGFIDLNLCLN